MFHDHEDKAGGSGIVPLAASPNARKPWAHQRAPVIGPANVLIGASTGGPQALIAVIGGLAPILSRVPVCVTLHMPPDLMPVIAAHVARVCQVETRVVTSVSRLDVGIVYFAPGNQHLTFRRDGATVEMHLVACKPNEYCTPAIDVMFTSAAACHGIRALGIILSGMGKDGLAGSRAIVAAGGVVLAQDKASSAVWGMPGAVTNANLASATLEPRQLGLAVLSRVKSTSGVP